MRITVCHRHLANGEPERPEVLAALRSLGHDVQDADDRDAIDFTSIDLLWIQGNANWYPRIGAQLIERRRAGERSPRVIVWHSEPLPPPPGAPLPRPRLHLREIAKIVLRDRRATDPYTNASRLRSLAKLGLPDLLIASSRVRQEYLASCGITSHFVPLGYYAPVHGRDLALERDVDVLFLGTMQVPRRRKLIAQLRDAGVNVRTEGSWTAKGGVSWGEARTELLNRTKVLINISRHPGEFAGLRMILGMANGALIVSEPMYMPEPYVAGEHFVECPINKMAEIVRHYLERNDERQRIATRGHRLVTEQLSIEQSVQRILILADNTDAERAAPSASSPTQVPSETSTR